MRLTLQALSLITLLAVAWILISPAVDLPDSTGTGRTSIVPVLTALVLPILATAAWMPAAAAAPQSPSSDSPLYAVNCSRLC